MLNRLRKLNKPKPAKPSFLDDDFINEPLPEPKHRRPKITTYRAKDGWRWRMKSPPKDD